MEAWRPEQDVGRIAGTSKPGIGPTTGLIVSEDGHILTSTFNFRHQPRIITVILRSGQKHVAKLLGRDDTRRICVLKIDTDEKLPLVQQVPVEQLRVGQWAISVGVGYGDFEPAVSAGIISARNRHHGRAVQTDANISPANYGGPLVAIDGRVIGICVALHPDGEGDAAGVEWYDSGIGFAIPLNGLDESLTKLKAGEDIRLPKGKKDRDPKGSGEEDSETK